ncbi:hypothetical protein [uncultured Vagococcus sp.]|uniref:hypothetical protein n=1 Tax=uncultured Vagococcus sp. TaxID=189676 RepID=UPI0028CFE873|nr:hypothetical protein [uncultured Vagococcus sp.]
MNQVIKEGNEFIGYEYKDIITEPERASLYLDGYRHFGWVPDDNFQVSAAKGKITLKLKRNRKLLNKAELTRLQRHFDSCVNELDKIQKSATFPPMMWAILIGLIGTALIAGSTFAVTADSPMILLCVILAIPGFICWAIPPMVYQKLLQKKQGQIEAAMEQKYDEIDDICQKGDKLL